MNIESFSMNIILHAGNAKNYLHEALQNARNAAFDQVEPKMKQASDELLEAHKLQTKFIQEDTKGGLKKLPVLLVHAQDHLRSEERRVGKEGRHQRKTGGEKGKKDKNQGQAHD